MGWGAIINILTTADKMYEEQTNSFAQFSIMTACEIYPVWAWESSFQLWVGVDGTLKMKYWIFLKRFLVFVEVFVGVNTHTYVGKPEVLSCRNEIMHVEKNCLYFMNQSVSATACYFCSTQIILNLMFLFQDQGSGMSLFFQNVRLIRIVWLTLGI